MNFATRFERNGKVLSERKNATASMRVNLTFQLRDGKEGVLQNVDWDVVGRAWAMTRITPSGTLTCHIRFDTPTADYSVRASTSMRWCMCKLSTDIELATF
jgi:hypothetical protein